MKLKKLFSAYLPTLLLIFMLGGCDNHTSPTGRDQTLLYSDAQMQQMGHSSFEQMKQNLPINRNPQLNAYVDCITGRILAALPQLTSDKNQQNWEVVLFDSPQVNAFALPGGFIGIYTGMLNVARTPDELAAVISHEVAHVLSSHGNEQASRTDIKGMGLKLVDLALDLGEVENRDLIMAALGLGAEVGISLPYGRAQETEADIIGLELMARAGFNPKAAISLWQNMANSSQGEPFELLSTHPSHGNRIEELTELLPKVESAYRTASQHNWPHCMLP